MSIAMKVQDAMPEPSGFGTRSAVSVWLKRVLIGLCLLALLCLCVYGIKKLLSGGPVQKKQITTVKLIPDTPPPPPPPPKEQPKPEPKEQPKEAPKEPEPKPVETPPAENLKMEGAAGEGPSPFQSGQVTKEYEKGDLTTGPKIGGKKNLAAFLWFTNKIDGHIKQALAKEPKLASAKYQVDIRVTLTAGGDIAQADLMTSSGNPEVDTLLKQVLSAITPMGEQAPEDMPRKAIIRVTSQNLG